jgi:hypothetical protein
MKNLSYKIPGISLVALVFTLGLLSLAQNASSIKTYQQWAISDVEKLLNDSPWAKTKSKGAAVGFDNPIIPSGQIPLPEYVTLRLHSALPIRQAIIRLRQIQAKYDKMSNANKSAFDAKQRGLIECTYCANNYVITLGAPIGKRKGHSAVLRSIPLETLKHQVRLTNESGEKRGLVGFATPRSQDEDTVLYFSRFNEKGEPLVTAANKKVILSLDPEIFWVMPVTIMRFEFDVSQMIKDGEVIF